MGYKPPLYSLREICDLAKQGHVEFSLSAENDYMDLGYSKAQAKEVVAWLSDDEYKGQKYYDTTKVTWDVYLAPRKIPRTKRQSRLYIKLRLRITDNVVYVTSFHIERLLKDD